MQDETCNGWKNYPTWAVNLWLSNDEPLYREALELTASASRMATEDLSGNIKSGIWTLDEATRFEVSEQLHEWVRDVLAPDLGATFAADLFGYALGCVDWYEIADAWIEMVSEASPVD